jgi:hypothetical protein
VLADSPIFAIVGLIFCAIAGIGIGMISGWLISLLTRCGNREVWWDGFLGSVGFLVGLIGTISMPWHENTVTEQLEGGGTVTTTMSMYQHPVRIAVVVAVILPLLHELYRFKRSHTNQP